MKGQVLITGGAGFLGFALGKHLASHDYEVHLVDNLSRGVRDLELQSEISSGRLVFKELNLLEPESLDQLQVEYDYVFHLAAIIGVVHVLNRPYQVLTDNVKLLANMLEYCRKMNTLKRLLFASTSEVYAGTLQNFELPIPTPENTPLAINRLEDARTSYMLSKIYGEALCLHSGVPTTIFRPHNVYGPRMGMAHIVPEQLRKAFEVEEGSLVSVPSADHRRCFLYIDDAVEILRRMMESPICDGETLNLGQNSEEVTIEETVKICCDVVGKKLEIQKVPATAGSPQRRVPDIQKAIEYLNYPPKTTLREGVERTFDWYRENIFNSSDLFAI